LRATLPDRNRVRGEAVPTSQALHCNVGDLTLVVKGEIVTFSRSWRRRRRYYRVERLGAIVRGRVSIGASEGGGLFANAEERGIFRPRRRRRKSDDYGSRREEFHGAH
jgi:hypothetical protein